MFTTFGFSRSAGTATNFARAKIVGLGGPNSHNISYTENVQQLGDEMFEAFCMVCENLDKNVNQNPQSRNSLEAIMRTLQRCPWLLNQYPWLIDKYPLIFKLQTVEDDSYKQTLH